MTDRGAASDEDCEVGLCGDARGGQCPGGSGNGRDPRGVLATFLPEGATNIDAAALVLDDDIRRASPEPQA